MSDTITYEQGITCIDTQYVRPQMAACYLMEHQGELALIETGTNRTVPLIQQIIREKGYKPEQLKYIIPTHVHLDHAGGSGLLMQEFPDATLVIHPRGARHMINPEKLEAGTRAVYGDEAYDRIYGHLIPVPEDRVIQAADGDTVSLGDRVLTFIDTPGHASHHFCVWDALSKGVFTGDTGGLAYLELGSRDLPFQVPTTTPVQFDPEALKNSISRLMSLQPDCFYLTHYGRLPMTPANADEMYQLVDLYVAHARRAEEKGLSVDQLAEGLLEDVIAHKQAIGVQADPQLVRETLAMDFQLNSQGLMVWLERQSKTG